MHDPICLESLWWLTLVKHQSFLHTNMLRTTINCFICTSSLPIPRNCCSIGPHPIWILSLSWSEKIPFLFSKVCFIYISRKFKEKLTSYTCKILTTIHSNLDEMTSKHRTNIYLVIPMDQTCRYQLQG